MSKFDILLGYQSVKVFTLHFAEDFTNGKFHISTK